VIEQCIQCAITNAHSGTGHHTAEVWIQLAPHLSDTQLAAACNWVAFCGPCWLNVLPPPPPCSWRLGSRDSVQQRW